MILLTYFYLITLLYGFTNALTGPNVEPATNKFMFAVSIGSTNFNGSGSNSFCSGSLVSSKHVITTERCLDGMQAGDVQVTAGSVDLKSGVAYTAEALITYKQWALAKNISNINKTDNNIAFIALNKNVTNVNPVGVRLFSPSLAGQTAKMAGWGLTNAREIASVLQVAEVTISSSSECLSDLTKLKSKAASFMDNIICSRAIKENVEKGDNGGPLSQDNELTGIIFEMISNSFNRNLNSVNLFANISYYRDFILDVMTK